MRPDSLSNSHAGFAETQWSIIKTAANVADPMAADALERLCATYWPPIYSFLRRRGLSTEDARDVAQDFFYEFVKKNFPGAADREQGRFRSFLLGALKMSLSHIRERSVREKRGGHQLEVPLDAMNDEGLPILELEDPATPEAAYEQRWAITVLATAFTQLRAAANADEKESLFHMLAPYLWGEKGAKSYAEIGQEVAMAEGTVRVAMHRLRQKYRAAVRAVIRETVLDPTEVDAELAHLLSVLGKR